MHPNVGNMSRHALNGLCATYLEKWLLVGGVVLQNCRTKLKSLGPLGPTTCRVFAAYGEHRRTLRRFPGFFDTQDLLPGKIEHTLQSRNHFSRRQFCINFNGHNLKLYESIIKRLLASKTGGTLNKVALRHDQSSEKHSKRHQSFFNYTYRRGRKAMEVCKEK